MSIIQFNKSRLAFEYFKFMFKKTLTTPKLMSIIEPIKYISFINKYANTQAKLGC